MGEATAVAHPNIALVKYWGKRDHALNLPAAGSVSLTLGPVRTRTTVRWGEPGDRLVLDGETADATATRRVSAFLDLVRALVPDLGGAEVVSANDFPTAAGLASSSSGFAALAVAATEAAGLALDTEQLSVLARRGSGSAARSVLGGFVRMNAGIRDDGTDSFAVPVADVDHWDLRVVIAVTEAGPKEPQALTWSTTDPDEVRRLFFGLPGEETLNFAVTPTAPNGCGTEYGAIATEYVEVTVSYRLPAESE